MQVHLLKLLVLLYSFSHIYLKKQQEDLLHCNLTLTHRVEVIVLLLMPFGSTKIVLEKELLIKSD